MFLIYNDDTKTYSSLYHKIIGFRMESEIQFSNPVYDLLKWILNQDLSKPYELPNNGEYYQLNILKINSWKDSLITLEKNKKVSKYGPEVQPGDSVYLICHFRLNNTHFHINTLQDYQMRIRRANRYSIKLNLETNEKEKIKQPLN